MQSQIEWNLILHGNRLVIIHGAPLKSSGKLTLRQTPLRTTQCKCRRMIRAMSAAELAYNARAPMSLFRYGRDFYTDEAAQQLLSAGAWLLVALVATAHWRASAQAVDRPPRLNLVDTAGSSPRTRPAI